MVFAIFIWLKWLLERFCFIKKSFKIKNSNYFYHAWYISYLLDWQKYYVLAENNNRSPWGFAILGIIIYYGSQFAMGIGLGILMRNVYWQQ